MKSIIFALFFFASFYSQSKIHISDALTNRFHSKNYKRFKPTQKSNTIETDTAFFFVRNIINQSQWDTIPFYRIANNANSTIWLESSLPESFKKRVLSKLDKFNNFIESNSPSNSIDRTKGMIELSTNIFGLPPNIDQDDKLDILLLDVRDSFDINGAYVAGFFDPIDQTNEYFSNQKDIIYIDIYPGLIYQDTIQSSDEALATLAHEYQHLINFNYETKAEITFLNEGLSEVSEILHGFKGRSQNLYLSSVNMNLFSWGTSNNILVDYQRTSLFHYYLYEKYGLELIKNLCQDDEIGLDSYQNVLENYSTNLKDLVFDFHLTNLLNQNSDDYNYASKRAQSYRTLDFQSINHVPFVNHTQIEAGALLVYDVTESSLEKLNSNIPSQNIRGNDNRHFLLYYNDDFQKAIDHKIEILEVDQYLDISLRLDDGNPDFIHSTLFLLKNSELKSGFILKLKNIPHDIVLKSVNIYGIFNSELNENEGLEKIQYLEIRDDKNQQIYEDTLQWFRKGSFLKFETFKLNKAVTLKTGQSYHIVLKNLNSNYFNIAVDKHKELSQSFLINSNDEKVSFTDVKLDAQSLQNFNVMIYLQAHLEKEIQYNSLKFPKLRNDSLLINLIPNYEELKILYSYNNGSEKFEFIDSNFVLKFKKNTINSYFIEAKRSLNKVDIYNFSYAFFDGKLIDVKLNDFRIKNYSNTNNTFQIFSNQAKQNKKLEIISEKKKNYSLQSDLGKVLFFENGEWNLSKSTLYTASNKFRIVEDTVINASTDYLLSYSISEIYPNPTNNKSMLKIVTDDDALIDYSIYSLLGKKVYSKRNLKLDEIQNTIMIEWSKLNLASGVFFISISIHQGKKTEHIIKKALFIRN